MPARWLLLLVASAAAQDLPRGQVIERVAVSGSESQSYALYIPGNYSPDRAWPILYCLDPGARGRVPVERFSQAAEHAGFLVAGSNNSRNGPIAPSQAAIIAMVDDTHRRLTIDNTRMYAAGLSGGARLALAWAQSGGIAGVVACSAGYGSPVPPKQIPYRLFATAGVDDFNHDELYRLSQDLAKRSVPHRFVEFIGGHEWLPAALAGEALEFFSGRVPPQSAPPSKEQAKLAARFEQLRQEIATASDIQKPAIVQRLTRDAARTEDGPDRRLARRVIGSLGIESMERGRSLMQEKEYAEAARLYETAVLIRPENPGSWYSLAVAHAAAGNTKRALEALEHAIEHGFRDATRIREEPLFARLHREARYQALLARMP